MRTEGRSRSAWLSGANALDGGDKAGAAVWFGKALELDEGMADAWLGLHAAGVRQDEAIPALARSISRFGEERRRSQRRMRSRFSIGPYVNHTLESVNDAWCAIASRHIDRSEYELAGYALNRVQGDSSPHAFVMGRLAWLTGDGDRAILLLRQFVDGSDEYLEASARVISGHILAERGVLRPAHDHFTWLLSQKVLPRIHVWALYRLGLVARERGNEDQAMNHFEAAYARDPGLEGLKEAMALNNSAYDLQVATDAAGDAEPSQSSQDRADSDSEEAPESVADVLAELDAQVGQDSVKRQVRILLAQTRAQVARREAGLPESRLTQHFVFVGPPGTGKTTIARFVARLYKALGILERGHVVEVDRSSLIGEYLGHTVAQTTRQVDAAIGGVLFIDEAYALNTGGFQGGDAFGAEAVDTLLKRMEDDRDRLVVIAAGYSEPMQKFLDSNPGLRSRFTSTVEFEPYSADELAMIGDVMAERSGNVLTDDARRELSAALAALEVEGRLSEPAFGNARYVRNVIEKAASYRDLRIHVVDRPTRAQLIDILPSDLQAAIDELR